MRRLYQLDW